jgi:CRP-like cAMP-binding protein/rubredoxin
MAHWMCTACGYYLQALAPPDGCPSCKQACAFNDVTCYRPECGGEQNIDPLVVGSTLRVLKGGPEPAPKPTLPSQQAIPLVDLMMGLTKEQREQLKSLGRIEHYDPSVAICTEGTEARKLYLVEEGQVAVESQVARGMRFPISIVYPGQAFGWSALVLPYVYTATVMALSKTRVIAIEQQPLLSMMQANPLLGFSIMQNVASIVASRLRSVEITLAGLLKQAL